MNRLYTTILAATALTFTAAAQQLPNAGFEEGWAGCTPWVTGANTPGAVGETPANWKIAQVAGYYLNLGIIKRWTGSTVVGEKSEPGFNNSGVAVRLFNAETLGNKIPGYMTLGTSWNTATTAGKEKDGGSFGGVTFTYAPDAISFQYKRSLASGSTEQATVVAYTWKGTYTQIDVPANVGDQVTCTMIDRDRHILGMETPKGGDKSETENATLVASINYAINGAAGEWTYLEIPFDYNITEERPEKINVIFSAGNYFSTDPVTGNDLTIDDIKLVYYSRLKSLSVNGTAVADFDPNTYEYAVDAEMPTDASAIVAECLGNSGSGKAVVALDAANNKATITVTNTNADMVGRASTEGVADVDGQSSHVYTLTFKAAEAPAEVVETMTFVGTLSIDMDGESFGDIPETPVILKKMSDGTYTLLLEKFLGSNDITFENVVLDGTKLSGTKDDIYLTMGDLEIHASGTLDGTLAGDELSLKLNILWHNGDTDVPIDVTFNGTRSTSAIGGIESDVIDENVPVEYYNIQGVKVNGDNLAPGFYIVRQGKKVSKIFVK